MAEMNYSEREARLSVLADEMVVYRAKHRLNQTEFGELCGLTTQTICSVEQKLQTPSRLTEAKIRLVLDGDQA